MRDVILAFKSSSNHRDEILSSDLCGCFYCVETFSPNAVQEWVDWPLDTEPGQENARGTTALCPKCGIDSVIGTASGNPITIEFLEIMNARWFK